MLTNPQKMLCSDAIEKWGAERQLNKVEEELTELLLAVIHYRDGKVGFLNVIDEIADVYIVIEQLSQMITVGDSTIRNHIARKMDRLKERVLKG